MSLTKIINYTLRSKTEELHKRLQEAVISIYRKHAEVEFFSRVEIDSDFTIYFESTLRINIEVVAP